MAYRSTLQHRLPWQDERQAHNRERQPWRELPGIPRGRLLGRFASNQAWSSILYLALRCGNRQLPWSVRGHWVLSQRVPYMEQGLASSKPARLSLETRAMPVWLERRGFAQMVWGPKANYHIGLCQAKSGWRTPHNETSRTDILPYQEQQQTRRHSARHIRRFRNNSDCLRAAWPQMPHDGARPTLLRCYTQTLVEAHPRWQRRWLGGRNSGIMSRMRLPEWLEAMPNGPHKRDEIRRIKNQRRKERLLDYACSN